MDKPTVAYIPLYTLSKKDKILTPVTTEMTLKCILKSERNYARIVGKGKIIGDRSDEWFPGVASHGEGLSIKGQGI